MIEDYAFSDCTMLEKVYIPASVAEIKEGIFNGCEKVVIYGSSGSCAETYANQNNIPFVKETSNSPYENPDFTLPSGMRVIEEEAFFGIGAERVKLAEGVTKIGSKAFGGCPNLKSIYIPQGCTNIAFDAFSGVSGLTIYGAEGSYAEFFANKYHYGFETVNP